jgi:hypothetical protein
MRCSDARDQASAPLAHPSTRPRNAPFWSSCLADGRTTENGNVLSVIGWLPCQAPMVAVIIVAGVSSGRRRLRSLEKQLLRPVTRPNLTAESRRRRVTTAASVENKGSPVSRSEQKTAASNGGYWPRQNNKATSMCQPQLKLQCSTMAPKRSVTDQLYRLARASTDARAASKGPGSYARRQVRRIVYRREGWMTRKLFRSIGL